MDVIATVGTIALSMVLVGSAVIARRRAGEPVARNALIWAAIIAAGFMVAVLIDRHGA